MHSIDKAGSATGPSTTALFFVTLVASSRLSEALLLSTYGSDVSSNAMDYGAPLNKFINSELTGFSAFVALLGLVQVAVLDVVALILYVTSHSEPNTAFPSANSVPSLTPIQFRQFTVVRSPANDSTPERIGLGIAIMHTFCFVAGTAYLISSRHAALEIVPAASKFCKRP